MVSENVCSPWRTKRLGIHEILPSSPLTHVALHISHHLTAARGSIYYKLESRCTILIVSVDKVTVLCRHTTLSCVTQQHRASCPILIYLSAYRLEYRHTHSIGNSIPNPPRILITFQPVLSKSAVSGNWQHNTPPQQDFDREPTIEASSTTTDQYTYLASCSDAPFKNPTCS